MLAKELRFIYLFIYTRNRPKFQVLCLGAVIKTPDDCHGKSVSLTKIAGIVRRVITCTCQWRQSSSSPPSFTAIIGILLYVDPHET